MSDLLHRIRSIEERLKLVLASYEELKQEKEKLTFENAELIKEKIRLKKLNEQYILARDIAEEKVRQDSEHEVRVKEIKIELKQYISEIDNCLELLQN